MAISADEVKKVATLARLAITEDSLDAYTKNLCNILDLVEQMSEVNTEGVMPMAHPLDMVQRLRPDVVTESNQRDYYQHIAPEIEEGLYLVPKVLE